MSLFHCNQLPTSALRVGIIQALGLTVRFSAIMILCLVGCSSDERSDGTLALKRIALCERPVTDPVSVSIVALLANPERFDGKPVAVIGFYHDSFEHSALYLHRDDFRQSILRNGLWVQDIVPAELNNRHARIEGIFSTGRGHGAQWSGTICGVTKATTWGPAEP